MAKQFFYALTLSTVIGVMWVHNEAAREEAVRVSPPACWYCEVGPKVANSTSP